MGFFIEIENRATAYRHSELIQKIFFNPFIRDQLVLRHIYGMSFNADSVLNRAFNPFRERCCVALTLIVLKYLCLVFSHNPGDININYLPGLMTNFFVLPRR